jgi:hypothetical protein
VVDLVEVLMLSVRYLPVLVYFAKTCIDHPPGTTPALRLGPGAAEPEPTLLLDDEPFPEEPSLLGAAGPVAGVAGVAVGRDMVLGSRLSLADFLLLESEYSIDTYPSFIRGR